MRAALAARVPGPRREALQATLERLTQFEGLIQNQHYLPYAEFKLLPYFKRAAAAPHRRAPESAEEPLRAAGRPAWPGVS